MTLETLGARVLAAQVTPAPMHGRGGMSAPIRQTGRKRLMMHGLLLLGVLASYAAAKDGKKNSHGDCVSFVPLHRVFTHPTNALPFADGRSLRGELYSIGGWCVYPLS